MSEKQFVITGNAGEEENDGFRKKLAQRQVKANSLVCVGLDPLLEKLPGCLEWKLYKSSGSRGVDHTIAEWMIDIVDATAPYASMFKPQKAQYEALRNGSWILKRVVDYIHSNYPDILVFLDCKRGDIGRTQERYRIAHFEIDGVDGMNFSPYMGSSCMKPLFDPAHPGRAIVGLCYTSNPEAREVQDVILRNGRPYWEFMAGKIKEWAFDIGIFRNAGLVMAAAYENPESPEKVFSQHLSQCRKIVGDDLWFLIPGIGTQKGFLRETVVASYWGPGSIAINSSSDIIFASSGEDYAYAAGQKAKKMQNDILDALRG